jgi:WD40 repeat protein
MIFLWQSETGELLYMVPGDFETEEVYLGDWSPTGDRFTTRGFGGTKVYDTATGRQLFHLPIPGFIYNVKWSPDGSQLFTTATDGGTGISKLWDAESGQEVARIPGLSMAFGLDWSPSGDLVAVGTGGFSVHVWNINKDQEVLKLVGAPPFIWHVAFSPGGERILATGEDNTVKVYGFSSALLTIPVPPGLAGGYWSHDGEQIAFGYLDATVKIFDSDNGDEELLLSGHEAEVYWLAWSPSGDRILTCSLDMTARIWDANTGEQLLTFVGHTDSIYDCDWSPDGTRISSSDWHAGNVLVWDSITGDELLIFTEHSGKISQTTWSPDGERILSLGDDGEAWIWDPTTGEILLDLYDEDFAQNVVTGVWTKDGQRVYIHSSDSFVRVFDTETGDQLQEFPTPNAIGTLTLSPTEERFLIGNSDGSAKVYNASTGAEMISYDDQGFVLTSYSPDGNRVLSGTTEGTLKVYPTWHSPQELIDFAKECCLIRQLTQEERELFGLLPRE